MRKLIAPIIGFFIIIGIYFVTHQKEQTQQEIKQLQLKEQQLLSKKQKQQKELNNLELLITQAYNNKNLDKLKSFHDMLLKFKVNDKYNLVSNYLDILISKTDEYIIKTKKYLKNATLQQHKNICLKQLNGYKTNLINFSDEELKKIKINLPNDKCYQYIPDEINKFIIQINQTIKDKQKKYIEIQKNNCLKQLNNLKSNISNLTNNDLRKLKIDLPNNKCYQYIPDEINKFIIQINQTIKNRNQHYYLIKRKECLKKLNSYTAYLDGNSISDLKNIQSKIRNLRKCNNYISNEINQAIQNIDDEISAIKYQQESFKSSCINQYNYLEKEYQNAKGFWNDNENKISDVKTGAIELKNKGCDKYLGNSLNELIEKCDSDL